MSATMRKYPANPSLLISASSFSSGAQTSPESSAITSPRSTQRPFAQHAFHRFARTRRELRKFIAQITQREAQPFRKPRRVENRLRQIRNSTIVFIAALEMPLGVQRQQSPGAIERRV